MNFRKKLFVLCVSFFFCYDRGRFFTVRYFKDLAKCKKYERFVSEKIKKSLIE